MELKSTVKNNPVSVLFLGACPALAATASVKASLGMALAAAFVIVLSALVMALLKKKADETSKTVLCVIVTAGFASMAQMLMAAFLPKAYSMLGIYVAICALNAMMADPDRDLKNSLISAVEFAILVIVMGILREVLGNGTFMGTKVPFFENYHVSALAGTSGAFIVFSILLAVSSVFKKEAK